MGSEVLPFLHDEKLSFMNNKPSKKSKLSIAGAIKVPGGIAFTQEQRIKQGSRPLSLPEGVLEMTTGKHPFDCPSEWLSEIGGKKHMREDREKLATAAMQGLLSGFSLNNRIPNEADVQEIAESAYSMAEAMIKARSVRDQSADKKRDTFTFGSPDYGKF